MNIRELRLRALKIAKTASPKVPTLKDWRENIISIEKTKKGFKVKSKETIKKYDKLTNEQKIEYFEDELKDAEMSIEILSGLIEENK